MYKYCFSNEGAIYAKGLLSAVNLFSAQSPKEYHKSSAVDF